MNFREDTDRMSITSQDTGFRNMITFFINRFCVSTFRTIPDYTESFKFIAVRFYNVTVIDVNDGFGRNPFMDRSKIRFQRSGWNTLIQMSGKTLNGINLFGTFMKLIDNVSQKAAARGKHTIKHICRKLPVRFWKFFRKFI